MNNQNSGFKRSEYNSYREQKRAYYAFDKRMVDTDQGPVARSKKIQERNKQKGQNSLANFFEKKDDTGLERRIQSLYDLIWKL
jgi:hypothetical protein